MPVEHLLNGLDPRRPPQRSQPGDAATPGHSSRERGGEGSDCAADSRDRPAKFLAKNVVTACDAKQPLIRLLIDRWSPMGDKKGAVKSSRGLAQLEEYRILAPAVLGSNPRSPAKFYGAIAQRKSGRF